jgi:hypothetical protein
MCRRGWARAARCCPCVGIDKQRQDNRAAERKARQFRRRLAKTRRRDRGNLAIVDDEIDERQALAVALLHWFGEQGSGNARLMQPIAGRAGEGEGAVHVSRLRALSCQRCSSA